MVVRTFYLLLCIFHLTDANVETLHFESGCLKESNQVQLRLQCSQYEHIEILRVIYGYSKQPSLHQCQFSIYDCIQDGASRNILSCNGKETCSINLTKNEILSTTVNAHGAPSCSDFNYIQVNFGCVPDAKDICDSWKEEGGIIHLSHTHSKDEQYNECQCKVRSSLTTGQVLLHAREINRQYGNLKDVKPAKGANTDCKKTTYLEIATDRSERKCMDNLPSNGNALFGSGSHNFTLTYVRNDPLSELFFYFELKASPVKKDHHVQIICNWARRTTTLRTTLPPMTRKRKLTTISMLRGGQLSRIDLIRHPSSLSQTELKDLEIDEDTSEPLIHIDKTTTTVLHDEVEEDEEETLTSDDVPKLSKSKKRKIKVSTTIVIEPPTTTIASFKSDDDEWSRILSVSGIESPYSKQLFPLNNRSFISLAQPSILMPEEKSRQKISTNKIFLILIIIISIIICLLFLYCLKVKKPAFIHRLKINLNVALLFCCEAGKLLFSSSPNNPHSTPSSPAGTLAHRHHRSSSLPIADYQSSEYYMNDTGNMCHTTQSIYEGKSIYSYHDDGPEGSEYMTKYDRHDEGDTC